MKRAFWIVGALAIAAGLGFAGIIYINIQDFFAPNTRVEQVRKPTVSSVPAAPVTALPSQANPAPIEIPAISPARRQILEAYQSEFAEINKRYRTERDALRSRDHTNREERLALSARERKEQKQNKRESRKDIQRRQQEELTALRAKYNITKDEEGAFHLLLIEERRQALLQKKNEDIPLPDSVDSTEPNDGQSAE